MEDNTTNVTSDWSDLLAGAKPCSSCGKHASIPAQVLSDDEDATDLDNDRFVWFCFECGHEDRHSK